MTTSSRLLDPQRSRALLVGAATFGPDAKLENLPTVRIGIEELHHILIDPERGGLSPSACRTLFDPETTGDVDVELWRCAEEVEDTFLVYYSGHGVPDPDDGSLHLAVSGTDRKRVHSTAVPIQWVRSALKNSNARAKVVILDCCFSGRAIQPMSAGELAEEADIAGSFVMAAAAANAKALAPEGERFTAFTGALIDVLKDGDPEAGDYLDLETIFRRARSALRQRTLPEPQAQRINQAAQLALSRNPARTSYPSPSFPADLLAAATSPDPAERARVVRRLARLARGRSRHAPGAARLLDTLAHDGDPEVAATVAQILTNPPTLLTMAPSSPTSSPSLAPASRPASSLGRDWFESEPLWFRTGVFYELQVPSFYDTDSDGVGDLNGVAEKADYLQWLGIDCVVLSPLMSPTDLTALDPDVGDIDDLTGALNELHQRGIRVVCDLPVGSLATAHPWFQDARASEASSRRDWFVWADDVPGDTADWSWDELVARHYRRDPVEPERALLRLDNALLQDEFARVADVWLRSGVDGLRLLGPPLDRRDHNPTRPLVDRVAGVVNGLDERVLIVDVDRLPFDDAGLPADTCIATQIRLAGRLFSAIAREDRRLITEALPPTQSSDGAQWGLFIRDGYELRPDVLDEVSDALVAEYAKDPRMRLLGGIRRRLAPMLNGDRDVIELLHVILLALPGSPLLYYGDEIGMGDNVYLGGRDGLRTPMQWTGDRNGGFSHEDFAYLASPPVMDPVYGFQSVNVESQLRTPVTFLRWLRELVAVRRAHQVFGFGEYQPVDCAVKNVFTFARTYEADAVILVANLSRRPSAVALDLSAWRGRVPVEMLSQTTFPTIGEAPYTLTLSRYGSYLLELQQPSLDD